MLWQYPNAPAGFVNTVRSQISLPRSALTFSGFAGLECASPSDDDDEGNDDRYSFYPVNAS